MKSSYLLLQLEKLVVYCLVPRPSHHPFFDRSTQNRGGRPGPFYHVNDVSVYLGRQGGEWSPIEGAHFTQLFFILV